MLNDELREKQECLKYLGLNIAVDGGIYMMVMSKMNKM